jgi:hypothetical protein
MPELINGKRCRGYHNRNDSGKRSGPTWKVLMRWLMDNGFEKCQICGVTDNLTFDHIIAWSNGGSNDVDNYAILCAPCNEAKGNKYMKLEPLVWPHPMFNVLSFGELEVGMQTLYGRVEMHELFGAFDDKRIYVARFSGENVMRSLQRKGHRKPSKDGLIYRPSFSTVYLDPRYAMV